MGLGRKLCVSVQDVVAQGFRGGIEPALELCCGAPTCPSGAILEVPALAMGSGRVLTVMPESLGSSRVCGDSHWAASFTSAAFELAALR